MKTTTIIIIQICLFALGGNVMAQYAGCPNQGSDVAGHLAWRLTDPATNMVLTGSPTAGKIYKLEIYETPYNPVSPNYVHYDNIGIYGIADGFKLYSSVSMAQNSPDSYFTDSQISTGVGPDVGSTGGVATFGIKTLDSSDPDWSGQVSAIKAYGLCYPSISGYTNKFFKKVLTQL